MSDVKSNTHKGFSTKNKKIYHSYLCAVETVGTFTFIPDHRNYLCAIKYCMLSSDLSSHVLEFPNDAYTTLSRNLIGCSTLSQE